MRKRGAPTQPRGVCPSCGKKGLGNTYWQNAGMGQPKRPYRQCTYCSETAWQDGEQ